jgi:hypothetical protein
MILPPSVVPCMTTIALQDGSKRPRALFCMIIGIYDWPRKLPIGLKYAKERQF